MSTRASIQLVSSDKADDGCIYLYRGTDGYPDETGVDLVNFLLAKTLSCSIEYVATQLVLWDEYQRYSISTGEELDVDYKYIIDCLKQTIKVFKKQWIGFADWSFKWIEITHSDQLPKKLSAYIYMKNNGLTLIRRHKW